MTVVEGDLRQAYDSDVLLSDGRVAKVRSVDLADRAHILSLLERVSEETRYLRFFTAAPARSDEYADRILRTPSPDHAALVAVVDGRLVAVAEYERTGAARAEVALLVDDAWHGDGIGTLLIEHLAAIARTARIEKFEAAVLPSNSRMHDVFNGLGFSLAHEQGDGVVTYEFPVALTDEFIEATLARELVADMRSLEHILRPRSIVVIGASRRRGTVGGELFRNLLRADFAGSVFPVNPSADAIAGVRAYPSVSDVPGKVDLAVITVPAAQVLAAVEDCGRKGVGGVVVVSAGFREVGAGGTDAEYKLVQIARRYGMRLVGPNCMGVVNTEDEIRMDATFAPVLPVAGRLGFLSQSGALGIAVLEMANQHGLGISTFVSVGNKADVSGNDLLAYWEQDANTDVIALYLESFGNPRKFARLARRVARVKPIVAMKSGRSQAGARAGKSHTASAATPDVAVDALFRQAGIVRVDTMEELFDVTAVLLGQPLPRGRRLAVVGNSGGPGVLAADAADAAGLELPEFSDGLLDQLRRAAPGAASLQNPVDLGAGATAEQFRGCLDVLASSDEIDCVLTIFTPPLVTRLEDVEDAIVGAAVAYVDRPVVANLLVPDGVRKLLPIAGTTRELPTFMFPEAAVRALARAADYADWRQRDPGTVPAFDDIDIEPARAIVDEELRGGGGWLSGERALELVGCYGVPTVVARHVTSAAEAATVATDLGFPVVLKAASGDLVHKTEEGGVVVGLATPDEVRAAYELMAGRLGDRMGGGLVEPMARGDVELIVGVAQQESFGPVVMFGLGGVISDVIRDRAFRLVPMTDVDAHELVRSLRGSPLLFGYRGRPAVDVAAVEQLLLRVARLVDDVPEIAELDLNPVLAGADGVITVDAKVRIAPVGPYADPLMRRLR